MVDISSPISEIFILDKSGIPLLARYYKAQVNPTDSVLLGGFFSAIEIFAESATGGGRLTDIGMTGKRFYFMSQKNFIIVVVDYTSKDLYIDSQKLKTINHAINCISTAFELLYAKSKQLDVDVSIILEGFDESLDSFIMESSLEYSLFDDIEDVRISKGKNIDLSSLSTQEFTQKIRDIFKK